MTDTRKKRTTAAKKFLKCLGMHDDAWRHRLRDVKGVRQPRGRPENHAAAEEALLRFERDDAKDAVKVAEFVELAVAGAVDSGPLAEPTCDQCDAPAMQTLLDHVSQEQFSYCSDHGGDVQAAARLDREAKSLANRIQEISNVAYIRAQRQHDGGNTAAGERIRSEANDRIAAVIRSGREPCDTRADPRLSLLEVARIAYQGGHEDTVEARYGDPEDMAESIVDDYERDREQDARAPDTDTEGE